MNAVWHATHTIKTASAMPAATVGKTANEIQAMVWAAETAQGPKAPEDNTRSPEFEFIAEVFGAICDPEYWKNPFLATNPQDGNGASLSEWVQAAVVWYHAATPKVYQTEAGPRLSARATRPDQYRNPALGFLGRGQSPITKGVQVWYR